MLHYSELNSTITLERAIQELRQREETKGNTSVRMPKEMSQTFEQHDVVHVLFGCGTTIKDEIAAHIWMLFGTTAKLNEMHRVVADREHRNVLSGIGHLKLLGIWVSCLPRIFRIMIRCSRMEKRLPLEELEKLKEQPLCEIRRQYGIFI